MAKKRQDYSNVKEYIYENIGDYLSDSSDIWDLVSRRFVNISGSTIEKLLFDLEKEGRIQIIRKKSFPYGNKRYFQKIIPAVVEPTAGQTP